MNNPILILLHGMGEHTADSFKGEVVNAANNALHRYEGFENYDFDKRVDIKSIDFDKHFKKMRTQLAENAAGVGQALESKLPGVNVPSLISKLLEIEAGFGKDKFTNTHILDVLLYVTEFGQLVRTEVGKELLEIIRDNHHRPIHILCHSLGTAVAHDTLNQLYTNDNSPADDQLFIRSFPITTYWSFANVSRLVTSFTGLPSPFDSLVKPGHQGMIAMYYNIRHSLDPFTLKPFKRFDPDSRKDWVSADTFHHDFKQIITTDVSRKNTHDIMGYLEDPKVCHDFLNTFFEFKPPKEIRNKGDAKFKNIQAEYMKIKAYTDTLELTDPQGLKGFFEMIVSFKEYVKGLLDE